MLILDLLNYAWRMGFMPFIGVGGSQNYEIKKSLRLRGSASAYLSRTFTLTNRRTWTWSAWVKRGALTTTGTTMGLFEGYSGVNDSTRIFLNNSGSELGFADIKAGVANIVSTSADYRDPSAWMHVLVALDTTQATAANRVKLYINGVQQTSLRSSGYPAQNTDTYVNAALAHYVGNEASSANRTFDGYMSDVHFIDGQALTPSDFGQTDSATGAWVPKKYTGTYGTNGFYLGFSDGTSLTTLGNDESGNNNDWTLNNISLTAGTTYDWMDDTPTNNFPVVLSNGEAAGINGGSILDANLRFACLTGGNPSQPRISFLGQCVGKIYFEVTVASAGGFGIVSVGVSNTRQPVTSTYSTSPPSGFITIGNGGSVGFTTYGTYGVAIDFDSGQVWYINTAGSYVSGDPVAGTSPSVSYTPTGNEFPYLVSYRTSGNNGAGTCYPNFGQQPFAYTPPAGFKTLSTKNLPTPAVKRGDRYFDANTRTGTGASFSVTGKRFSPDLVWTKSRSAATDHVIYDSVRGATKQIESNTTTAETTEATGLTAFNADGFSGGALAQINTNAATYVDWMWEEAAGFFDIVTYTGTGVARTVAHALGVVPAVMIVKARNVAGTNWIVYHKANTAAPETDYLALNTSAATADLNTVWNDTAPTSSLFTIGTDASLNANGNTYVAYLFAEVEGFSRFASYTGNGSADGPFVWCGFRPRWIMWKRSDGVADWSILDATRDEFNLADSYLTPNSAIAETVGSSVQLDIVSNGFKVRGTWQGMNANGGTYIFIAFAETPFKYANAR
jgi:hypothetical protein